MKKFMIFLLMAFLYLGTCQARSEASHPDNAKLKLLGWVTPAPSQSFLTRSIVQDAAGTLTVTPESAYVQTGGSTTFTANFTAVGGSTVTVQAYQWFVDDVLAVNADGTTFTYTESGANTGTHRVKCVVTLSDNSTVTSNIATIFVNNNFVESVEIIGVAQACAQSNVTLTAVFEGQQLEGFRYVWFLNNEVLQDGQNSVQYLNEGQQISFIPDVLFENGLQDVTNYEFKVEISYAGCSRAVSPVFPFTYYPAAEISLIMPDSVCELGSTAVTASLLSGPTPNSYRWFVVKNNDNNDTLLYATTTTPEITFDNSYLIDSISEVGVTAYYLTVACNDTAWKETPKKIETLPLAQKLSLSITQPAADRDTFCVGTQVGFKVTDENDFGTPIYTWFVNGQPTNAVDNAMLYASYEEGMYIVTVSATYANDPCQTVVTVSDTVYFENVPELAIAGVNIICAGTTSNVLTATEGFAQYQWTKPGETPAVADANKVNATLPGLYLLTATSAAGCVANAEFLVEQIGADFQVAATEYYVCAGSTVALNATLNGWNNENISYDWYKINGTDTSDLNYHGSTYTATVPDTATVPQVYLVKASAGTGCEMEQNVVVNVLNEQFPAITFASAKDTTVCAGSQAVLKINDNTDYSGAYNWYLNGIQIQGEHLDSISYALEGAGEYVFSAKRANVTCANDTVVTAQVTYTVIGAPALVITGDNMICQNAPATMTVTPNVTGATYTWIGPDTNATKDNTTNVLTTTVPGVYAVTMDAAHGCGAFAQFTVWQVGGDLQVYASEIEICPGAPVMLNAQLNGFNNQNIKYAWTMNGEAMADSVASIVTYPVANGQDSVRYGVTAYAVPTDSTSEMSEACALTSYINIYVKDTARVRIAGINVDPVELCQGGQVGAKVQLDENNTATVNYFKWFLNGVELAGMNMDSIRLNLNEPGTYKLAVTPLVGECGIQSADTAEETITVGAIPTIAMTGNNVICSGDSAEIVAVPSIEGNYTYTWFGPDANVLNVTDSAIKTNIAGVYTVTVKENASGCIATNDFTIMQFGADLQVTADQTTVCENTPVVLNANLDGFNNENISYEWTKVGGAAIGNGYGSTITVTPTATTKYAVKATAGTACVMNDTIQITVTPTTNYQTVIYNNQVKRSTKYQGSYNVYSDQNDRLSYPAQYCEGQEIALYYVSDSRSTDTTASMLYNWFVDGNLITENSRDMMIPAGIGIGSHYITAMAVVSGCNTATMSNSLNFIIHAAPEVTISGNNVICNGDTAFMTANATTMKYHPNSDVVYGHKYTWSNGKEFAVDTITTAGTYTVTATNIVSGKEMCSTTATVEVNTFGGDLQVTADQMVVCAGEPVVLNANLDGFNNENVSYAWTAVGGSALGNGSTIQVNPTATTKYAVKATAGDCEMNDTINIVVSPGVHYTTTIAQTAQSVCLGDQTYFTATSEPAATYYEWYIDGVQVPGENLNNLMVTFDDLYLHYVKAKAVAASCDTSELSNIAVVSVNRIPEISLTGNNVICNGDEAHITATVTNDDATFTYIWSNTTENNAELTATESGIYTVTVTNTISPNCSAVAEVNVTVFGADLQLTADQMVVCAGEPVVLNANLDGFNNENVSYAWTAVGGSALGNGSTIQVNPTATTKYAVKATAGDCEMNDTINIVVSPGVHYTTTIAQTAQSVCLGDQTYFTATSEPAATYYEWYIDGVQVPGENLNNLMVTFDDLYLHYVKAKAVAASCDTSELSNIAVVSVNRIPEISLTGNNVICNGDEAHITATVTNDDATFTYIWSNTTENNAELTATESGIYTVTVTNTISPNCSAVAEVNVTVFGSDLQITADKVDICAGEYVTINANIDGYNNENVNYTWTSDPASTIMNSSSIVVNPTQSTKYVVTAQAGDCSKKDSININVNAIPGNIAVAASPAAICEGAQDTIYVTGNNTADSYIWYQNGIEIPGQNLDTIIVTLNEAGSYSFAAKGVSNHGCVSESASTTPAVVTVNDTPEFTLTGNNIVCNGATATITATPADYTYTWSAGGEANDNVFTTTTAGTYSVTAANGTCTSVQTFNIYTNGSDLQVYADKMEVCEGEMVVLNANLDGFTNDNIAYSWAGQGLVATTGSTVSAIPTTTNYTYTVTATTTGSNAGCTMTGSINITVHAIPTAPEFTVSDHNICAGEQVTLEARHTGNTTYTYTWYQNGTVIEGADNRMVIVTLDEPGEYYFRASRTNEYGCTSSMTIPADGNQYKVTVHAAPDFTLTGNNIICNGATATITATSNTDDTYTYTWSAGGEANVFTTTTAGTYSVTATDGTCTSTQTFNIYTTGADLQLVADKMEICEGEMITLNANNDGFINENVSYAWEGNGLNANEGSTVSATPSVDADGFVKYVVTATAGNCTMIDSISINVTKVDTIKTVLAGINNVCQGGQISAYVENPEAAEYTWYLNGLELFGQNQDSITLNMNENGAYTLAAKAVVEGCNVAVVSEPVAFTVDSMPVVTITGNHYYTVGSTTATLTASNDYGFTSYVWSDGQTGQEITVSAYGVYTVTATTANGCVAISEPFTVSSVVDLQAHIEGVNAACQHDVVTLTVIVEDDLEGHTYQWMVNGEYIDGATAPQYQFNVNDLYTQTGVLANEFAVEVKTTTSETCHTVTTPVHSFLITPVPMAVVAAPEKVCEGNGATLEAIVYSIGDNAQYQYVWYMNGQPVDTIDYITTYEVAAENIAGNEFAVQVLFQDSACSSPVSEPVTIQFYTVPGEITMSIDESTICTTNQATLTINDNNDEETFGAVTYTWFVNGIEMNNVNGNILTADFDHNGEYTFWAAASYPEYPCALIYTDTVVENVVMHPTVALTGDPIICHGNNIELYAELNDTVAALDYSYEWRLYNYTIEGIHEQIDIASGSPDSEASDYINNGNTSFDVYAISNDPWLSVYDVNAQDYPYVFTVVVTTPQGCRVESDPYFVYVNDTINVVTTVDYDTVCFGGTVNAVAHLGNYNTDNLVYQWYANGEAIPYGTQPLLTYTLEETTNLTVTVTQTTSGCTATSDDLTVTVFNPQNIHHIVAINHDDEYATDNVCEGAQLDITAYFQKLDDNGNPIEGEFFIDSTLNYVWTLNGMQLQTIHGPQFSAQAYIYDADPVDYTYTAYVVYDIPGCEMVPVASNTVHVKRNPIVTIDGNPNVCYFGPNQENIVLTAWVDGDVDLDATYTWFESGQLRPNPSGFDNKYRESWVPTYDNPYIFTVEVTNGDGCTTISDPFYVNVYERPYTNITGNADAICEGGNVTLNANLNNYNDPMLTYQWYQNEVNNTHILAGATHEEETFMPTTSTDYIVKVTHLMDFNTQYCVAYDTFHVDVNAIPELTAEFINLDESVICEGRNVTMAAGVIAGGVDGGEIYTWYRNGEIVPNNNTYILNDNPMSVDGEPVTYTYAVSVRQAASGCESEIFTLPTITVNPNPVVELVTDPIVCNETGNNVVLTANVEPAPATDVTYRWFENNEQIAETTENTYSMHKAYRDYPYSFSVKLSNDYGCIAESSALVYVNDAPVVNITATETNVCVGGEVTLTASLNDWNADMLTFQWYDGDQAIAGATSLTYTVAPNSGEHKYNVRIHQLTSECNAASDTITVNVAADPVVTINYTGENTVCDGYQVVMNAVVEGGVQGGEVYTWYRNGQVIEGAVASVLSEVVSAQNGEPTVYKYAVSVMQAANGCESNVYNELPLITVNPNPTVMIQTDPIVCVAEEDNVTLVANVYPTNANFTYRWFEDNVEIAGETSNTLVLTKGYSENPYNFSVAIVNDYACTAVADAQVYVNANPVVNITVSENAICVGGEITLAAALNDWNADMLTFQWYDGDNAIAGATSLSYTYAPALGDHTYTLVVNQLTSGCTATSNALDVTVNAIPKITSVTSDMYNVCNGGQIAITAATNVNSNDGIFTWYRNGILMEGATAATIYDAPGTVDNNMQTYVYSAVVTYPQAGCTSLIASSDVVTVYPNPMVQITGDQHVCETDSVFLIANVDTTGMNAGNLHFTWYESGQIRDNMGYNLGDNRFFAEYLYARTEPYRFTVDAWRGDDVNGCVSHSAEYLVYVYPQPVVNITATATEVCENGEVTLTANLNDYNAENLTYQWFTVGTVVNEIAVGYDANQNYVYAYDTVVVRNYIPGATLPTYTTTVAESTVFGVEVLQTNSMCTAVDAMLISVMPAPSVTVALADAADSVVCRGAQIDLVATPSVNAEGAVYTWFRNGQIIPGAVLSTYSENVFTPANQVTVNEYTVQVSYPVSGCVSAVSAPAVVTVNPAPTFVTISGNNVVCEGTTTTLTANSDVEGTYAWSNGATTQSIEVGAGSYTVVLTTAEGCQATSDNFTVDAFGTDLIVTASEYNICEGENVTLFADQNGWQGNVTYNWTELGVNANSVNVTPDTTTTYHVTATVVAGANSCDFTGAVTINVNPRPAAPVVTVSTDTICNGSQMVAVINGANAGSYTWYINGVEQDGQNMNTIAVNAIQAGNYNFAARAVSEYGCVSEMSNSNALAVVVDAPASVTITGNNSFCDGGMTTLYANAVTNVDPAHVTYAWFKDGVAMNIASTDHINVTEAGSYKVIATVYDRCSTESMNFNVTVEQAPQLQLTATESTICVNGTTVIAAEATGWNNVNVNYNWNNGFQGSAYTFTPNAAGTYKFIVTASQATAGCVAVDSIVINVNAAPAAPQISVDNAVVCTGGQVNMTISNADANATYTWYRNGSVIAGATTAALSESPVAVDGDATTYTYTVIAELANSGCVSATSAPATVTVIPAPVAEVSVDGNTTVCANGTVTLNAHVSPAAAYSYQWYKDNVLIPGATQSSYTASEAARETAYSYKVEVTANAGCTTYAVAPAINFVAQPVVEATISTDIACVGGTATLTAIVNGGVEGNNGVNTYSYAWYRNVPVEGETYSTTELVANTPVYTTTGLEAANQYSYYVVVSNNAYGCNAQSNLVNFNVVSDPVVTIARVAEYPASVCDGGNTALKANVAGGFGAATYQWFKNGNMLVGETNQVLYIDALAYNVNDTYAVEVSQEGVGCSGSASAAINTLVTVVPTYTVDITGFGNVCEGGTLTLNATVNGVIDGDVLSYQWYKVSNGNTTAIANSNSATYSTSDLLLGNSYDYYVVVTSNIAGCSVVSNSVPANVVAAPSVAIQGANTVCEGGSLTLNAFVTGGVEGADYTYTWNWTGAANGTATTATPNFVPTLTASDYATPYYFTVTVNRTDNTGCTATSAAHEVNVQSVPTVSVTADNSYVCQNGQVSFTAHVSPVGSYNYVWTINGEQLAVNASTVTTSMATTGTINATVVVSAANASSSCSATATIATPVNVVAVPTVTLTANNTTMCVGGVTTLTATVNANNNIPGNFNYEWIVDGAPVSGVTNTLNQTLTAAGIHTYQVRVSQNNDLGCASSWSNQATVQVAEQPVVALSSQDGLSICEGGSVTMTGVVTNYGTTVNGVTNSDVYGAMTFNWTRNGANVNTGTVNAGTHQFTETLNTIGNYTYQVTADAAGYNCLPQVSNTEMVSVVGNPSWTEVHVYSNNNGTTAACIGDVVMLQASIQGGVSDGEGSTGGYIQWVVTDENGNTTNVSGGLGGNSFDTPAAAGSYTYTPTFVGNIGSGCQLTNTDDVEVGITVYDLPTATFVSGDGASICANDGSASAELVISFTGVAPFHYEVVDASGNVVASAMTMANTVSIYVSPSQQTTYRINMVSDAHCENSALDATATATVYVNAIEFADNMFVSGCNDNGQVTISFNQISGNPTAAFNVVYENGLTASGNISNNTATFAAPTVPGDYNAVFTVDGCSYDIVVRVLVGDFGFGGTLPIMDIRWNDVVVVNNNPETNGGHTFVGFQWYHNGVAIPGATYSNYQDKDGLNGFYSVELIEQDANGNMVTFMTCETYFATSSTVKVYPVPANVRQEITIELDLTSEELEGAVLDIYNVNGAQVRHITELQPITKIEGFVAQGTYFGRILTGTNEIKTVKFVIVK